MQITITALKTDQVFTLEIPADLKLEQFKEFCEAESGIPATTMVVIHNGIPLNDNKRQIKDYGIKDHDMVALERSFDAIQVGSEARPSDENSSRSTCSNLLDQRLLRNNLEEITKVLKEQQEARNERERLRIRMLTADPMDMEAQRLIAQEIENKNIEQNMEFAMEYTPESFGTVVMLYIDCKVNGHKIKAFVDSGAQATIMSQKAAERCNIMRLVDKRWAGIAKGVGTQKIIGRVHIAQIQIENDFISSSFSILEEQPMDMLLGLDMLKRHQCSIDLKNNVLMIGSTGTKTPFLAEADLPECARLNSRGKDGGQEDIDEAMKASVNEREESLLKEAIRKSEEESKRLKSEHSVSASGSTDTSGSTPSNDPNSILPNDKFTEQNVKTLMGYGFPRDVCIRELRAKNGDERAATAALFASSLKF